MIFIAGRFLLRIEFPGSIYRITSRGNARQKIYRGDDDRAFERYLDLACNAEAAGFSAVYVIDHLLLPAPRLVGITGADPARPYFLDCWCTLAALAARTKKIRIGPQVTPIGLRHPVFVAKWGATVFSGLDKKLPRKNAGDSERHLAARRKRPYDPHDLGWIVLRGDREGKRRYQYHQRCGQWQHPAIGAYETG